MIKTFLIVSLLFKTIMLFGQNQSQIETVFVKGGRFEMGGVFEFDQKLEKTYPEHDVYVSDFHIGKYEITNEEYCNYLNSLKLTIDEISERIKITNRRCFIKYKNGECVVLKGYQQYPVVCVSWEAANEFCDYYGGRLPTEAEWEYAAKGGQKSKGYKFSGSNDINEVGITTENAGAIQKIGTLKPNELGIYDMSGNVEECCHDWCDPNYYRYSPLKNPMGPNSPVKNKNNVLIKSTRGGAYNGPFVPALNNNRSTTIVGVKPYNVGFRICFPSIGGN